MTSIPQMARKNPKVSIPAPVIARLTQYLAHARHLQQEGIRMVASREIAHALGLTSSTVRQDLSHIDFSGTAKRGYETAKLADALNRELGADRTVNVAVIGAGNLGRALALHAGFERECFPVRAVFDANPRLVGKRIGGMRIEGMDSLPAIMRREDIGIGIVAVPKSAAQKVADLLILSGVKGILNLTTTHIRVPKKVALVEVRIVSRLQELQYLVTQITHAP